MAKKNPITDQETTPGPELEPAFDPSAALPDEPPVELPTHGSRISAEPNLPVGQRPGDPCPVCGRAFAENETIHRKDGIGAYTHEWC